MANYYYKVPDTDLLQLVKLCYKGVILEQFVRKKLESYHEFWDEYLKEKPDIEAIVKELDSSYQLLSD